MTSAEVDAKAIFVAHLAIIDRLIAAQCRRHGLRDAERDEFDSWVKARFVESDYAALRKFAGRSSITTYLATVLANLFRDYCNATWGRWRPSAQALRMGPHAIRLEQLLYRDQHSQRDAMAILLAAFSDLDESAVRKLIASLPPRTSNDDVSLDEFAETDTALAARDGDDSRTAHRDIEAVEAAVRNVVGELPPEEAVILQMRYWSGCSVADIARAMHVDQKGLYRRLDALHTRLRLACEARGIDRARVADILMQEATL